jgi:hypothetical protein
MRKITQLCVDHAAQNARQMRRSINRVYAPYDFEQLEMINHAQGDGANARSTPNFDVQALHQILLTELTRPNKDSVISFLPL